MAWQPTKPRGPVAAEYSSPGPRYALPTLLGQHGHDIRSTHVREPAFPFGIKHGRYVDDCSPGPAYFPNPKIYRDGKDGTPHVSLSSRHPDLSRLIGPGPGAYAPENCGQHAYLRHPAFTFGTRHRHRQTDIVPAANRYTLPPMLGKTVQAGKIQAPCFTMVGRSKTGGFSEDLMKTPGPGAYNTYNLVEMTKDAAPKFTMTSRSVMPGDATQKPGPGAHTICEVSKVRRSAPAYTFGIRHSQYTTPLILQVDN